MLTYSIQDQLALIHSMFSSATRMGVVYSDAHSTRIVEKARDLVTSHGLQVLEETSQMHPFSTERSRVWPTRSMFSGEFQIPRSTQQQPRGPFWSPHSATTSRSLACPIRGCRSVQRWAPRGTTRCLEISVHASRVSYWMEPLSWCSQVEPRAQCHTPSICNRWKI